MIRATKGGICIPAKYLKPPSEGEESHNTEKLQKGFEVLLQRAILPSSANKRPPHASRRVFADENGYGCEMMTC